MRFILMVNIVIALVWSTNGMMIFGDERSARKNLMRRIAPFLPFVVVEPVWSRMERYRDQIVVDADGKDVDRVRRYTGEETGFEFRKLAIDPFNREDWPDAPQFSPNDFKRIDENDDFNFYSQPRLVSHIDEGAAAALTNYYKTSIPVQSRVLDLCSSWVSHFPESRNYSTAIGLGMNDFELRNNPQLNSYVVQDLNKNPTLPFPDNSFDIVTIVVSIDYLTQPITVLREIKRVLSKPNGKVIISQSNRCFFTKATRLWLGMGDFDHLDLIGRFLFYAGFDTSPSSLKAYDITARGRNQKDPMYVVECQVGHMTAS
mmetsp:Transcript_3214/g.4923  ORF Transcript_3214/g.4923 Transcript_3214/m.4923 type:complete len:316 (-) Transcript_3214:1-948(-)